MSYTPIFHRPYPDGYKNRPFETTPETAETLNAKDDAIINIEEYLAEGDMGTTVVPNPEMSGDESALDAIQIGDEKFKIEGGGGNANIWYGTHAEYEEQKDNIADGTQVCFTDDIGLEAGSEYYSETEQVIGTYMGKPLYRRVFTLTQNYRTSPNVWTPIDEIDLTGVSNIVYGANINASGTFIIFRYGINASTKKLQIWRTDESTLSAGLRIILEYIKEADSVVGVINGIRCGDVYSDTEQVIGSWFGKPLYRKVFPTTLPDCVTDGASAIRRIELEGLNIEDCPRTEVYVKAGGYSGTTPYFSGDNPQRFVRCYVARGNGVATHVNILNANTGYNGQTAYLILEYTKTTD